MDIENNSFVKFTVYGEDAPLFGFLFKHLNVAICSCCGSTYNLTTDGVTILKEKEWTIDLYDFMLEIFEE